MNTNVPGTLLLVEEVNESTPTSNVLLQPTPSSDPEDPLNWSRPRKLLAVGTVYLYVFGVGIATAVQYSVLDQISIATGIQVGQLNLGTGLMFLFLGWANLLWQPIALVFGRRGVYLISTVLSIAPMIWAPYSHGAGQWYAHRILLGIFSAPVESLPEISVPDLFFAHERGTYMAIYTYALFGSNFLAPLFAGFINDGVGWEWVMYFGAIVLAGCAILEYFFMEETIYFRRTMEGSPSIENEKPPSLEEAYSPTPDPPKVSYTQKLHLFQKFASPQRTLSQTARSWLRPISIFFFFPNIVWAGFLYGTNLAWVNIWNGTISTVLGQPPYNLAPRMVGVAYLSPIFGGLLASFWSGSICDHLTLRLVKRNNGIREAEQRLWILSVSALFTAGGLLLYGIGASRSIHVIGPIIGLGMATFGAISGGSVALAYAVDCFKDIAGESMITVIIIRNTLGFAFNYAIVPWLDGIGLQNCFASAAMIALGCTLSFLLMTVFGKRLRKFSAKRYWRYVGIDRGMWVE